MSLRMAALATFIAALPLSVDAPGDSTTRSGETRVTVAGSLGQYGIVSRGCNGEILDVAHRQLRSGALVIEHETPQGIVIGVRGGQVLERKPAEVTTDGAGYTYHSPSRQRTNHYVNPFLAYEGGGAGIGLGYLHTELGVLTGNDTHERVRGSGHLRLGPRDGTTFTMRLLEDVPLQSEGAVTMEFRVPVDRWELGPSLGLGAPYDGAMFGFHGRVWLTPAAAASIRAGLGDYSQYYVTGGLTARWPAPR